jgi:glyoxylase-like metal-dependent hydrolase (beta-lactamase superfamily II)
MPDTPDADELEVSVFGPGVGECVLLHVGDGEWFVIDSCLERKTRRPVALAHLDSLGVPAHRIRGIVVTHWHDDHVRGVAKIAEEAVNARVFLSLALQRQEFLAIIQQLHNLDSPQNVVPIPEGVIFHSIYPYFLLRFFLFLPSDPLELSG